MKATLKFLLYLAVAIALMVLLRLFVCTIVTVTDNSLAPQMKAGDRLLVCLLGSKDFKAGQWVMFTDSLQRVGKIAATAGDTITVDSLQYEIPTTCSTGCDCEGCRIFLVEMGKNRVLVKQKNIKGRAYRLFNLKLWW